MSAVAEALERELRIFRVRLREVTSRWYAASSPPFATRADVAFHVVVRTAQSAYELEFPGRPLPPLPRLPDLALADQLDVVAHDLRARMADGGPVAITIGGALLAELLLHRMHLDGATPGRGSAALAAEITGQRDALGWAQLCAENPLPA